MAAFSKKLISRINSIIEGMLGDYDIESTHIEVAEDASGDEAIFIDLNYRLSAREFDPAVINAVLSAVSTMLIENGEHRFPDIRHHLPRGQKVKSVVRAA